MHRHKRYFTLTLKYKKTVLQYLTVNSKVDIDQTKKTMMSFGKSEEKVHICFLFIYI